MYEPNETFTERVRGLVPAAARITRRRHHPDKGELLIDCKEDRIFRAVLIGMYGREIANTEGHCSL